MEPAYTIMDGRVVDMCDLKPGDWSLAGVADKLSKINRYAGATEYPFSVAQHAILVAEILDRASRGDVIALEGLHHDDPEAFTGDLISPVKQFTTGEFAVLEQMIELKVYPIPHWEYVCAADKHALAVEWAAFRLPRGFGHDPEPVRLEAWHREACRPMHHATAKRMYLEKHWELVGRIQRQNKINERARDSEGGFE